MSEAVATLMDVKRFRSAWRWLLSTKCWPFQALKASNSHLGGVMRIIPWPTPYATSSFFLNWRSWVLIPRHRMEQAVPVPSWYQWRGGEKDCDTYPREILTKDDSLEPAWRLVGGCALCPLRTGPLRIAPGWDCRELASSRGLAQGSAGSCL